jgi:uncharacterized membrane protein
MSLRAVALVAATATTGLMAGVFGLYAHTIMRGLGKTDDRTFVGAFQAIDRAIINPLFMLAFFGALVSGAVATFLYLGDDDGSVLPWVAAGTVLYLLVVAITVSVHLPLNDAIKAAGDPDHIDVAATRAAFHEGRWVAWNVVRVILNTVAFVLLLWALVVHGRDTASSESSDSAGATAGAASGVPPAAREAVLR